LLNPSNNRLPPPSTTGAIDDRQVVDEVQLERLADHVRPTDEADILVAGGGLGRIDRLREPVDEHEVVSLWLLLQPVRDDEARDLGKGGASRL
jgi:hypothetical protein